LVTGVFLSTKRFSTKIKRYLTICSANSSDDKMNTATPSSTRTPFVIRSLRRLARQGYRPRTAEAILHLIGYSDGTLRPNDAIAMDAIEYLSVRYDISPEEVIHRLECIVDS
jgi:hypothetical protein